MSKYLTTLSILFLVFLLSCQPEEEIFEEYISVELTGAEYLAHFETPSAMFVVAFEDLVSGKRRGLLIDNEGNLSTHESIGNLFNPESETIAHDAINYTISKSEKVAQVDLDILVEQFKKIDLAVRAETFQQKGNPEAKQNVEFYGITLGVPGARDASCYGHASTSSSSYYSPNYYSVFCLKTEGVKDSYLNSENAKELAVWLKGMADSVK